MSDLVDFLTADEIATELRLDSSTVRRWIKDGQLPGYRIGSRIRIRRDDYEKFLAAGRDAAVALTA